MSGQNSVLCGCQSDSFASYPRVCLKGLWKSDHVDRAGGFIFQQYGLSLDAVDLANVVTECLICQQHSPPREPASLLRVVDYIGSVPSWRGQRFILTGVATYSACEFTFFTHNASVRTTNCGFTEYFYQLSWHSVLHCFWSRNSFHNKEGVESAHALGINWPCNIPHYIKVAVLVERWNGLEYSIRVPFER